MTVKANNDVIINRNDNEASILYEPDFCPVDFERSSTSIGESSRPPVPPVALVMLAVMSEEGVEDGEPDGVRVIFVGDDVGSNVVNMEGPELGTSVSTVSVGRSVCNSEGLLEGGGVGSGTGALVGFFVGNLVGAFVVGAGDGAFVGNLVGFFVGASIVTKWS